MSETLTLKPKFFLFIIVFTAITVGLGFSLYFLSTEPFVNARSYIKVLLPFFFFIVGMKALKKMKVISISDNIWKVRYLISGKKHVFSKQEVESTAKEEFVGYKSGIPYDVYIITLKTGEAIQFSTHEFSDLWICDEEFKQLS